MQNARWSHGNTNPNGSICPDIILYCSVQNHRSLAIDPMGLLWVHRRQPKMRGRLREGGLNWGRCVCSTGCCGTERPVKYCQCVTREVTAYILRLSGIQKEQNAQRCPRNSISRSGDESRGILMKSVTKGWARKNISLYYQHNQKMLQSNHLKINFWIPYFTRIKCIGANVKNN